MQATTSLFIDKYHPKADGTCSVSVKVTFERKKKYYPTGFTISNSDFEKTQGAKPRNDIKAIALKLQAFEKKASDVISELPIFSWEVFEKKFFTDRAAKDTLNLAFADYAASLRKEGQIGTAVTYECAQVSLNKFHKGAKFSDVSVRFLKDYENWMLGMENKRSKTTVGIYLRSLRTLFNIAIADGALNQDYYPFGKRKYEIPTSKNVKKALTLKQIADIYYYEAKKGSTAEMAKDYWLFMYLCNGINMKDMCLLKYENIKGEVLEFIRAKTIRTKRDVEAIRVTLVDDAKAIIAKWGNTKLSSNTYIFPILTDGLSPEKERDIIKLKTNVVNESMKLIAKELGIDNIVTTYAARHSFSTILQRSGAPVSFISEALGHSNVQTTQNYLAGFEDDKKAETVQALTAFKNERTKNILETV